MIEFVLPSEKDRRAVLDFYGEFARCGETGIGFCGYEDFDRWSVGMRNRFTGKNLPDGYVRENFYLCYENGELVGVYSLKFELTDFLFNYGGHIGYAVRPTQRNRGIASAILKKGLRQAKEFGFEKILAVVDEDNIASEKVILKNGGVYENTLFDKDENVFVKRYWFDLTGLK